MAGEIRILGQRSSVHPNALNAINQAFAARHGERGIPEPSWEANLSETGALHTLNEDGSESPSSDGEFTLITGNNGTPKVFGRPIRRD